MKPLRELFPIIDECESWLSQGRTGNDWGRRMRFASFIDEVKDYRIEATKYDEVVELWRKWEEAELYYLLEVVGKIHIDENLAQSLATTARNQDV